MYLGIVKGTVVAERKASGLEGKKLLLVQPIIHATIVKQESPEGGAGNGGEGIPCAAHYHRETVEG